MPLTPKQEKFAQCVASGMSQAEAYREAYAAQNMKDATIWSRASELMTDGKVTARVAELREPIVKEAQMTLKSHLEDLQKLRNMAVKAEQYSAAITAEIARGKAAGIHIEKSEQAVTLRKLEPLPEDAWLG